MAKFFDGKVTPNPPQNQDPDRYQNLGLREVEPNLGVPEDDGYMLVSDTLGNREWVPTELGPTSSFIPKSIINAKGDIVVGLSPSEPSILSIAPDGCVLVSDSNEYVGVKWQDFSQLGISLSSFSAKGDIIVGESAGIASPVNVGLDGDILTADSNEPLGVRWAPPLVTPTTVEITTFETDELGPGNFQDFWLDLGQLFAFISVNVISSPEDGWLRLYTSDSGRAADTRIAPGPPFPASNTGFALEAVTSPSEPEVIFLPVYSIFSENGAFFRFSNQSLTTQTYTLEFRSVRTV